MEASQTDITNVHFKLIITSVVCCLEKSLRHKNEDL